MGKKHRAKKNSGCRGGAKKASASRAQAETCRRVIAVHESGHGVAWQVLFGDLKQIALNGKGGGVAKFPVVDLPSRKQLEAALVVVFAGEAAERALATNRAKLGMGSKVDRIQANEIRRWGGFSDGEMSALRVEATRLVVEYGAEIRAVSDELVRCNRLWGDKVARIMARARAVPPASEGTAA